MAVLARTELRAVWPKVTIAPLKVGGLLILRPLQVAGIVKDGQEDIVATAAQIRARNLVGKPRRDAEGVLHRFGDDRGIRIGAVDLVRRPGDKVTGIAALLAEGRRRDVMTHRTRDAIPRQRPVWVFRALMRSRQLGKYV